MEGERGGNRKKVKMVRDPRRKDMRKEKRKERENQGRREEGEGNGRRGVKDKEE